MANHTAWAGRRSEQARTISTDSIMNSMSGSTPLNVPFAITPTAGVGRLRKFGGCDPAGIQGCISHDESLVLVYSTAQRSTELGSHDLRTAEPGQTLRTKCVALSTSVPSVSYEELSARGSCDELSSGTECYGCRSRQMREHCASNEGLTAKNKAITAQR